MPFRVRIVNRIVPEGAIKVGSRSIFENPFWRSHYKLSRHEALIRFKEWLFRGLLPPSASVTDGFKLRIQRDIAWLNAPLLRGHDLACFCPLDALCHGDVWLNIAKALPLDDNECADAIKSMLRRNIDFRDQQFISEDL